jgi:hypothetical protein
MSAKGSARGEEGQPPSGYARKFLSANMFSLKQQGHRVLVVRDETLIVFFQELKKTRDVMPEFT